MPRYLSHLAARALGVKPAVRPRLPSLFEPAPGTSTLAEPESSVPRVVEQERLAPQPPPAATTAPATRIDLVPAPQPRAVVAHSRQTSPEKLDVITVEPEPQKLAAPTLRKPLQPVDLVAESPQARSVSPVVVRPELRALEVTETSKPIHRDPAPPSLHSESKPQRLASIELPLPLKPRPQPDEFRIEPVHRIAESAPVTAPPARSLTPLLPAQPELRPAQRTPAVDDSAPQDSPSVQVTIGRLIVEAVAPAPTPAAMPAPRALVPRLSLDDYLRQRRSQG